MALQKVKGPGGEEFEVVSSEAAVRILNEGIPFIAAGVEIKKLVLKENEVFIYSDAEGNIIRANPYGLGLYYKDTRFLSVFELYIEGKKPLLLSSSAEQDYRAFIELTNPDIVREGMVVIPQESLNIRRLRVIKDNLYERIRIKNYNLFPIEVELEFAIGADFFDIFEIRGLRRLRRGQILKPKYNGRYLSLAYLGLDDVFRQTKVEFWPPPTRLQAGPEGADVIYRFSLKPHETKVINFCFKPLVGTERRRTQSFDTVSMLLRRSYEKWESSCAQISTDNELFNSVIERSRKDLRQLLTRTSYGTILAAGIPWFVAPFGRDGLISALEILMLNSSPARETLKMLSSLQGKEVDEWSDEEPGKIIHEIRQGELANLNEVPYRPYYGSIDSTPLFIILAYEYLKWSGDIAFLNSLLDSLEKALEWLDEYGDKDGDLFIEYERKSPRGLIHQGWKDSHGSVCHKNGEAAQPPIALVEVQGYAYQAKRAMAMIYHFMGESQKAEKLLGESQALKTRFNKLFWVPEENCFALALDKDKKQVKTVTSNPGQCLFTEIVEKQKARKLIARLMAPDMFSGWGIRTISKAAASYNPLHYHSGTIWPHDNALIAWGLKKYGFTREAIRITSGLFEAAIHFEYLRLPELFCGFSRRSPLPPVGYPVSCSPQAWATGSIFLLLQTLLGLEADALQRTLYINKPVLPPWLNEVRISNLRVGEARVNLLFRRSKDKTSFKVLEKEGKLKIKAL